MKVALHCVLAVSVSITALLTGNAHARTEPFARGTLSFLDTNADVSVVLDVIYGIAIPEAGTEDRATLVLVEEQIDAAEFLGQLEEKGSIVLGALAMGLERHATIDLCLGGEASDAGICGMQITSPQVSFGMSQHGDFVHLVEALGYRDGGVNGTFRTTAPWKVTGGVVELTLIFDLPTFDRSVPAGR